MIVELVRSGQLPVSRLDQSVRRLLTEKFRLGLFDHRRYVDPELAERTAGKADFRAAGRRAQSASITVLTNRDRCLPASGRTRLFVQGVDPAVAAAYADVVSRPGPGRPRAAAAVGAVRAAAGSLRVVLPRRPARLRAGPAGEKFSAAERRAHRGGHPPGTPGGHPRDQRGRVRGTGGVRRQRRRASRRRLRRRGAAGPAADPAAAEHGRGARRPARCAQGVGGPVVRLRCRAEPGSATIAA